MDGFTFWMGGFYTFGNFQGGILYFLDLGLGWDGGVIGVATLLV